MRARMMLRGDLRGGDEDGGRGGELGGGEGGGRVRGVRGGEGERIAGRTMKRYGHGKRSKKLGTYVGRGERREGGGRGGRRGGCRRGGEERGVQVHHL